MMSVSTASKWPSRNKASARAPVSATVTCRLPLARKAFETRYPRVQFAWSYKTNYLDAVCQVFRSEGWIADVAGLLAQNYGPRPEITVEQRLGSLQPTVMPFGTPGATNMLRVEVL